MNGKNHETDCYTDKDESSVEVHKWVGKDGKVHESHQRIDKEDRLERTHFKRDSQGKVASDEPRHFGTERPIRDMARPLPVESCEEELPQRPHHSNLCVEKAPKKVCVLKAAPKKACTCQSECSN